MRKRPNDVEKLDQISQSINSDGKGNLTVGKDLGVDGKLKLKSLVSSTNPDGDITKELGGSGSQIHCYSVIIEDSFHYEVYTSKNYNFQIGKIINLRDFITNQDYNELRLNGDYPVSGYYRDSSDSFVICCRMRINGQKAYV